MKDTAQQYIPEPNEDAAFVEGNGMFNGKTLGPFSQGIRLLWLGMGRECDYSSFAAMMLLWLLTRIQELFDETIKSREAGDVEMVWMLVKTSLLRQCANADEVRGKIFAWVETLSKKQIEDGTALAAKILKGAIDSDVDSEALEDEPGDGGTNQDFPQPLPEKHSQSTLLPEKPAGAKKQSAGGQISEEPTSIGVVRFSPMEGMQPGKVTTNAQDND